MDFRVVEIPHPVGDVYCHQHKNGTLEHHETKWRSGFAKCERCGVVAEASMKSVSEFLNNSELMNQLVGTYGEA